jgi:hypothetical protein
MRFGSSIPTVTGQGYWMVGSDGGVFTLSDKPFVGSIGARTPLGLIVAIAS